MTRIPFTARLDARSRLFAKSALLLGLLAGCSSAPEETNADPIASRADQALGAAIAEADPESFEAAQARADYLPTPAGLMHKDCITALPDGATIDDTRKAIIHRDGHASALPECKHRSFANHPFGDSARSGASPQGSLPAGSLPATNGWAAASWWDSPRWVRSLVENFTVPSNPSANGALLYLFPSLQNASGEEMAIIQPVLQWGTSPAGGGNYWAIAPWYVYHNNTASVHGPLLRVAAGDSLWGGLQASQCDSDGRNCHWTISVRDRRTTGQSTLPIVSGTQFRTVQGGVLEVYNLTSCNQLPASNSATFNGLQVQDGSLTAMRPSFSDIIFKSVCQDNVSSNAVSTQITWHH